MQGEFTAGGGGEGGGGAAGGEGAPSQRLSLLPHPTFEHASTAPVNLKARTAPPGKTCLPCLSCCVDQRTRWPTSYCALRPAGSRANHGPHGAAPNSSVNKTVSSPPPVPTPKMTRRMLRDMAEHDARVSDLPIHYQVCRQFAGRLTTQDATSSRQRNSVQLRAAFASHAYQSQHCLLGCLIAYR